MPLSIIAGAVFFSGPDEIRSTLSAGIAFRSQAEEGDGAVWVVPKKATDQVLEAVPAADSEPAVDGEDSSGETGGAPLLMQNGQTGAALDEETSAKVFALLDAVTDAEGAPESEPVCTVPNPEDADAEPTSNPPKIIPPRRTAAYAGRTGYPRSRITFFSISCGEDLKNLC